MTGPDRPSLRRRLEVGRLLLGSLLEMGIKAYGVGAAASVALSDAETVGGKSRDALAAVPSLSEEYRQAMYVVDHREEIGESIDYLNQHTPPQAELQEAADKGSATLRGVETTYDEVLQARNALPFDPLEALGHVRDAWDAKPDLESLENLARTAEEVSPALDKVDVLIPVYYGSLRALIDNFAGDEVAATVGVMAVAFGLSVVLGQAVGFWVRRGRPGLIARMLQRWGARTFRRWYVHNLPHALSPALYAAARERIQSEILADPENPLTPQALRDLEQYFASRPERDPTR